MATFKLGFEFVSGLQPNFTFVGASYPDYDPRSGTSWVVAGPTVTYQGFEGPVTLTETYWYLFGNGFDTDLNALPTTGTITSLLFGIPYEDNGNVVPPPAAPDIGAIYLDRLFAIVEGLNIPAADFAAAVAAGTIADFLLAGDDVFRDREPGLFIPGPVWLRGGGGSDTIHAGGLGSTLWGESGDDMILAPDDGTSPTQSGVLGSIFDGGIGDDTLTGSRWGDFLGGGEGVDRLAGQRGNDTLNGGLERDVMRGGGGDDWIIVAAGEVEPGEILDGGAGNDILYAFGNTGAPLDLTEAQVAAIERIEVNGTVFLTRAQFAGFQRVDISGLPTVALADAGFLDLSSTGPWYGLSAGARLTLLGSAGRDVINGRDTADVGPTIEGYSSYGAGDIVFGQDGNDVINGGSGNDTLFGGNGNDLLRGDGGIDALDGGAGADTLDSGGNPTPAFSFQNDVLNGGAGDDSYVLRHFNATVVELPGGGVDTVTVYNAWTIPTEVENLVIAGAGNVNAFGNILANRMTGNAGANNMSGNGGADTLTGGAGNDVLSGGGANDSLAGGADADALNGGAGADTLRGGAGADLFYFVLAADSTTTLRDVIADFVSGEDRIQMNLVDANDLLGGVQGWTFVGTAAFALNQPGMLRVQAVNATSCILQGNTDNDTAAEFAVLVTGVSKLSESDLLI
jgi:Ca2+-binding RTX toxin-like protein